MASSGSFICSMFSCANESAAYDTSGVAARMFTCGGGQEGVRRGSGGGQDGVNSPTEGLNSPAEG
eukprot:665310-Prorocentrum_minimum.AAC.1